MNTKLRRATKADFALVHDISNDPNNIRFISDDPDDVLSGYLEAPDIELAIWEVDDVPVGFALFCELDNPSGRTELRRLGLNTTGSGLGQSFLTDLKAFGFDTLGRAKIWLDVVPDNPRAIRSYEKSGFLREGQLRQQWKRPDGTVSDLIVFGLLRTEWQA